MKDTSAATKQHVFIVGSKSIGQYGGYETFVDKLLEQHKDDQRIKYHVACKANGDGSMDETKLTGVTVTKRDSEGNAVEFEYNNAHVFKIKCPNIGPAVAIYYDLQALFYCIDYCKKNKIENPIIYILTCRIGPFINSITRQIHRLNGRYYLNPDGHEWMRAKWSAPVRKYWKMSEKLMINAADLVICDSVNIEKYVQENYHHPNTTFIAYGADVSKSILFDDDEKFNRWLTKNNLNAGEYYLIVGRFVPENNYEVMIREFMKSDTDKKLAIITNNNEKYYATLEERLHMSEDNRIVFAGTVYDKELLKKIREKAYGYFHGHEVGGTNPSLLEALGSTNLNLLLDVGFNKEVGQDAALYWNKRNGNLSALISEADKLPPEKIEAYGTMAKNRIKDAYSWELIGKKYRDCWIG